MYHLKVLSPGAVDLDTGEELDTGEDKPTEPEEDEEMKKME